MNISNLYLEQIKINELYYDKLANCVIKII